jgi:protein-S-isoprenylcysteine O-methyltransferase Ste14
MSKLELKVPPLALALLVALAMWLVSLATPSLSGQIPYRQVAAVVLVLAGFVAALLGVIAFRRAGTTVNPTTPQSTSSLVSGGIYRVTRNPMYLGFLLALVGLAVFLANALSLVLVPAFVAYMNRFQIAPEERVLSEKFGEAFAVYKKKVRRWL